MSSYLVSFSNHKNLNFKQLLKFKYEKRLFILTVLIAAAFSSLSAQTEKEIKAGIKHVTVFPDRAQIDHEGTITSPSRQNNSQVTGSLTLYRSTEHKVKGFGEFTVLSVNHQNNYLQNLVDNADIESIRNQIEALQIKTEDEQAAISVLKEKAAFLNANRAVLLKETTISAENFKSIMDLYTNNIEQVTMSTLKKERLIKEYQKQISALQQQISIKGCKRTASFGSNFSYCNIRKTNFRKTNLKLCCHKCRMVSFI